MKKNHTRSRLSRHLTALIAIITLSLLTSIHPLEASSKCCPCATPCKTSIFCNLDGIELPQASDAEPVEGIPNPSCINVCGLPKWSVVKGLSVKLEIEYPESNLVSVVLLSPCGDAIVLLNGVGASSTSFGTNGNFVKFCFSDCDGISLRCTQDEPFTGIIKARPTDCDPENNCITGISKSSFGTALSATFCKPACGCWKLFTCIKTGNSTGPGSIRIWSLAIDHCVPCEKPCITCNSCNSCYGCPSTFNPHSSFTSPCNSCNSSCNSCH